MYRPCIDVLTMSRYFDVPIVHWCVIEEALLWWCNDFKSLTEVAFYLMTLQSLTGVVFALLMLKWSRCCISPVDVTMTHRNLDPSWHRCCSKTKENIYIDKHSYFRKELTVFTLLDSSAANTYLSAQILDEVLKKKESCKLQVPGGSNVQV